MTNMFYLVFRVKNIKTTVIENGNTTVTTTVETVLKQPEIVYASLLPPKQVHEGCVVKRMHLTDQCIQRMFKK